MIYLAKDSERTGPFSEDQIRARLASGELTGSELAWREGMSDWQPLSQLLAPAPASSPPAMPAFAQAVPGRASGTSAQPPQTSGLAIASLITGLGIFLLGPFSGLAAVITGHMARSQIKRSLGQISGAGMALTGLILGYLSLTLVPLAILAGIALPAFTEVQNRAKATKCLSNAKQIALGCKIYALDHQGKFPATVEELFPQYLPDKAVWVCPHTQDSAEVGYEYFGSGRDETVPGDEILLRAKHATRSGLRAVVHWDARGEIVKERKTPRD